MLVLILNQADSKHAIEIIEQNFFKTDVFELRLDCLQYIYQTTEQPSDQPEDLLTEVKEIFQKIKFYKKQVIFTLRTKANGGCYEGDESSRIALLMKLAVLQPDYVDIEDTVPTYYIQKLCYLHPEIKIIRSYHNFNFSSKRALNLDTVWNLFNKLIIVDKCYSADSGIAYDQIEQGVVSFKLIFAASSSLDNLIILKFLDIINTNPKYAMYKNKVTAHCMGELGLASRILGQRFGNQFTYCVANNAVRSSISPLVSTGIITIDDLLDIYNYKYINSETKIFALIGNPVTKSIGHVFHNKYYKLHNINAVYVRLLINYDELDSFFTLIKELPVDGLSVTMPFKTAVIKYINRNTELSLTKIQAINTIRKINNKFYGMNTDGYGAVKALVNTDSKNFKSVLEEKKVLILGAGGAAVGVIAEISQYNIARLVVVNRSYIKALKLKQYYDLEIYDLNELCQHLRKKLATPVEEPMSYGEARKSICFVMDRDDSSQSFCVNSDGDKLDDLEKFDYIVNAISYDISVDEIKILNKKITSIVNQYSDAKTIYMNINYHTENNSDQSNLNCKKASSYKMYVAQAIKQIEYWLQ